MQQNLLSAVTATTTSTPLNIENLGAIVLQFIASGISSGNGVFTIDGSNDGVNWVTGISFQDAAATDVGTYVTGKTLSANGSAGAYVPSGFKMIRVKVTVTTDGTYSAVAVGNKA